MDMYEKYCISNHVHIDICLLSSNEVLVAVLQLAKEKPAGLDNLSAEHLLHASSAVAQPLSSLFNTCIVLVYVPEAFIPQLLYVLKKMKIKCLVAVLLTTVDLFRLLQFFQSVLELLSK